MTRRISADQLGRLLGRRPFTLEAIFSGKLVRYG
jgi:hypothetical protein